MRIATLFILCLTGCVVTGPGPDDPTAGGPQGALAGLHTASLVLPEHSGWRLSVSDDDGLIGCTLATDAAREPGPTAPGASQT